ncbi:transglutaminase-like domain-containing protein [Pseudomonas sp. EpS/L25]|uniref:transglutaminase-like domain-containing protein n=1 Tax=Pseudomonas sp. EpS/L25 TaxID=1749078 RepID=UPI0013657D35|nr:transglutaminase-like domain-containing protein [Pseudomonas sp. EpS/L25]
MEFDLRLQNTASSIVVDAQVEGALPMTLNGASYEWRVESSVPVIVEGERFRLAVGSFGSFAVKRVRLSFVGMGSKAQQNVVAEAYPLTATPSSELFALAESFAGLSYQEKVRAIYGWMVGNIKFTGIDRQVEGATYALSKKAGDCTEHMLLAGELLARNGVTVRRVLGFVSTSIDERLTSGDLHDWLEVYDGGRWIVVDSSYIFYDDASASRRYVGAHYYVNEKDLRYQLFTPSDNRLRVFLD